MMFHLLAAFSGLGLALANLILLAVAPGWKYRLAFVVLTVAGFVLSVIHFTLMLRAP